MHINIIKNAHSPLWFECKRNKQTKKIRTQLFLLKLIINTLKNGKAVVS